MLRPIERSAVLTALVLFGCGADDAPEPFHGAPGPCGACGADAAFVDLNPHADAASPSDAGGGGTTPDASPTSACDPLPSKGALPKGSGMYVETFAGPVTSNEVASFEAYVRTLTPASDNMGNDWAQHDSGQATKAMGILYAITHEEAILDRMLTFCDAVLSERNDLAAAPVGQHVAWTGRIEPIWPNNTATPLTTAGEQGDPIGHLGSCARLVLESPALWDTKVTGGDPKGYGATYLARAKRYVKEADYALDTFVLKSLLDLSSQNRQKWSAASPPDGGGEVPWNQQMMFNYAFQNLAAAHVVLDDDAPRVAKYDAIVQASMDWFFQSSVQRKTDSKGNPSYFWGYLPTGTIEDNSHGNLDVAGFDRAYLSGRYGLTDAMMAPFANTFLDVMMRAPNDYAGRVDGTDGAGNSAPTNYVRPDYMLLAEFRPSAYTALATNARLKEGAMTGDVDAFSRFALIKTRRCIRGMH